jgi:DNA-binding NtrC family response regulator
MFRGVEMVAAREPKPLPWVPGVAMPLDLRAMLRHLEMAYIDAALTRTNGNRTEAAKLLGMTRTALVEKLRRRRAGSSRAMHLA